MRHAWIIFILSGAVWGMMDGCTVHGGRDARSDVAPDKVVYHVNDVAAQGSAALRNSAA